MSKHILDECTQEWQEALTCYEQALGLFEMGALEGPITESAKLDRALMRINLACEQFAKNAGKAAESARAVRKAVGEGR
jgi:hypothetical protein